MVEKWEKNKMILNKIEAPIWGYYYIKYVWNIGKIMDKNMVLIWDY